MNLSNKLNLILKDYSLGKKKSAYKRFKKIYLQNNKNIKLRYNLAVMQQELGLFDEAESNYISLIEHNDETKYKSPYLENIEYKQKVESIIDHLNIYVWIHNTQRVLIYFALKSL